MREKKYYTVKQWNCFKNNDYFDMQDMLCKKFDVILTDHKTKKEKVISILKKFNQRNFNKGMNQFNGFMKDFGNSVDQLTREFDTVEKDTPRQKSRDNQDLIWGKSHKSVPIWAATEDDSDSQSRHETNLEKIWGRRHHD